MESLNKHKAIPIHRKSFNIVSNNLPTYNFIKKNYSLNELASKIIASKYVKDCYKIIDTKININNYYIDWVFEKNDCFYFIKSFNSKIKNRTLTKNNYTEIIKIYLDEKDIKSKFKFIVNSVDFFKNKKPLIKKIQVD